MCEALNLSWSIVKNSVEGSSGPADAAKNKFRERFMILFPQDMDGLPDLLEDEPPPIYTDEAAEFRRKAMSKRCIFDSVSMTPPSQLCLMKGEDMDHLHVRNGLGELFGSLFMVRTIRTVVQVRVARQDKSMEDHTEIRGVEMDLRTIQFKGVQDIEEKLKELTNKGLSFTIVLIAGVIWAKYGLWCSKSLSPEDNLKRGEWMVFGTWPETLKCITSEFRN